MSLPQSLVVATGNPKKLRELEAILGAIAARPPALVTTASLGLPSPQESGSTFAENALIKARAAFVATGMPSIADDSGLCVDALDGAPGLRSARFSGDGATDLTNNAHLLEALAEVPEQARGASFRSCLALVVPRELAPRLPGATVAGDHAWVVAEGAVHGRILRAPEGTGGFGYDPLFFHPGSGQTFAELEASAKHALSHRGQAFKALEPALAGLFGAEREGVI